MEAGGRPAAILIAGPTASGKSALAARLAQRHGGVVINTDSMQVYGDLRRLTARPRPCTPISPVMTPTARCACARATGCG